ncbi:MAG: hypothetical protein HYU51_08270 [Candidatus Rokubacteria bacterium]|nr:hypothetical protein [Candidatus Rokubacteria bacterium]
MTAETADVRYLVIVSRERPDLFDELKRRFAGDPTVQVLLDRRVGERRQREHARPGERRGRDRREATMHVTASLWLAGYVIVRVR